MSYCRQQDANSTQSQDAQFIPRIPYCAVNEVADFMIDCDLLASVNTAKRDRKYVVTQIVSRDRATGRKKGVKKGGDKRNTG